MPSKFFLPQLVLVILVCRPAWGDLISEIAEDNRVVDRDNPFTYGNEVEEKTTVDTGAQYMMVLNTHSKIQRAGVITQWEYYAIHPYVTVHLMVMRPIGDGKFKIAAYIHHVARNEGAVKLAAMSGKNEVMAGDILAVHSEGKMPIPYDAPETKYPCTFGNIYYAHRPVRAFNVGTIYKIPRVLKGKTPCRHYALRIHVAPITLKKGAVANTEKICDDRSETYEWNKMPGPEGHYTYGSQCKDRAMHAASGRYFLIFNTESKIPHAGQLYSFEYFASTAFMVVHLMVVRPLGDGRFMIVAYVNHVASHIGRVQLKNPADKSIRVEPGDVLAVYYDNGMPIPYDTPEVAHPCSYGNIHYVSNPARMFELNTVYEARHILQSCRIYSYRVHVKVDDTPALTTQAPVSISYPRTKNVFEWKEDKDTANSWSYGNEIKIRSILDSYYGSRWLLIFNTESKINETGQLYKWEYYASRIHLAVHLMIVRPMESHKFKVISYTNHIARKVGPITVELEKEEHAIVEPGDVLALYWDGAMAIPYDTPELAYPCSYGNLHYWHRPLREFHVGTELYVPWIHRHLPCRVYSFKAHIRTGVAATAAKPTGDSGAGQEHSVHK